MKTLYLLRHAKSSSGDSDRDDHERPLDPQGERAATRMGVHFAQCGHRPTLVLCSSARRSVETLERLLLHLPEKPQVFVEQKLYLASRGQLLSRLAEVDDGESTVLVIGHNPELGGLAVALAGSGDREALGQMARKFPAAGLAALAFDVDRWRDVSPGGGRLLEFTTPKDLV